MLIFEGGGWGGYLAQSSRGLLAMQLVGSLEVEVQQDATATVLNEQLMIETGTVALVRRAVCPGHGSEGCALCEKAPHG
jgi:hypothetical protein